MALTCATLSKSVSDLTGSIQNAAGTVSANIQRVNGPAYQNVNDLNSLLTLFKNIQTQLYDIEAALRDIKLQQVQLNCDVQETQRQISTVQGYESTVDRTIAQIESNLAAAQRAEGRASQPRPTATSAQQITDIAAANQSAINNVRAASNDTTVNNQAGYNTGGNTTPTVSADQVKTEPAPVTDDAQTNQFLDQLNKDLATPFADDGGSKELLAQIDADAAKVQADVIAARAQQAINEQNKAINQGDWRVRLSLANGADYLYRAADPGILDPLAVTNGIIFPYTPKIDTTYAANYNAVDLTHSNYKGYFYQNSSVDVISLVAIFTAQDTTQANYLLATIHFLRSVTKMFYGQDANRGVPPPLVFLTGLGTYQFNRHPCLVSRFTYNLPDDVDYIRARSVNIDGTNLLKRRDRTILPTNPLESIRQRLENAGLPPGGLDSAPAAPTLGVPVQGVDAPTYVPTKMTITLELLPVQTRSQQSQQFSVRSYANGDLLKSGFW